jgi:hypothetical protein
VAIRRLMASIEGQIERGDNDVLYQRACLVRWCLAEGTLWPKAAQVLFANARGRKELGQYRWTIAGGFMAVERKLARLSNPSHDHLLVQVCSYKAMETTENKHDQREP